MVAAGLSALDWAGRFDATPTFLAGVAGAAGVLGAAIGAVWPIKEAALRDSVDRRAHLENRLTAAASDVPFAADIAEDAARHLAGVKARTLYPLSFGRWHAGAVASIALAASVFLLGSTPMLLSPGERNAREELKREGKAVERVRKEQFESPEAQKQMSDEERRLSEEARRLNRDLEKNRLSREEAMQKANELEQKAQELAKEAAQNTLSKLSDAETAMEKMERAALEKAGLGSVDPSLLQMPQGQKEAAQKANAERQRELQKSLAQIDKRLAEIAKKLAQKGLSEQERKQLEAERSALEAKRKELEQQAEQAKKEGEALKLSEQAKSVLDKMRNHELMKQIRELAEKLAKNAQHAANNNGRPQLTPEQRAELHKKLEELLSKLKDEKAMQQFLQQMLDDMKQAMQNGGKMERCDGFCLGLGALLGLKGTPDIGSDGVFQDTGHVNKLDKPEEGKGKTSIAQVTGARRETGEDSFVEIKAPTTVGNRTSVPYRTVLPSYRKKAEEALGHKEIPKQHEKRVRAYFDSLTKG